MVLIAPARLLDLVRAGSTNEQIADALGIPKYQVEEWITTLRAAGQDIPERHHSNDPPLTDSHHERLARFDAWLKVAPMDRLLPFVIGRPIGRRR